MFLSSSQHILGVQVTHQDMEAIDPNYYKNLLQITTLPLEDLGLDLTFSADTEMFGAFTSSCWFLVYLPVLFISWSVRLSLFSFPLPVCVMFLWCSSIAYPSIC